MTARRCVACGRVIPSGYVCNATCDRTFSIKVMGRKPQEIVQNVPKAVISTVPVEEPKKRTKKTPSHRTSTRQSGWVYLMRSKRTLLYKIGLSKNVKERLRSVRTGKDDSTIEVVFMLKTKDMYKSEQWLHRQFSIQRVEGEWFRLSKADVAAIEQLGKLYYLD